MTNDQQRAIWDVSWLAVPGASQVELLTLLRLSDAIQVTWQQGIGAVCGDYWDFEADLRAHLSRVFLPASIHGWQLAIGGTFGGEEGDERLEGIIRLCSDLSRRYSHAHAFTTQGRMDFFAWTLAHEGSVTRHFVWDGGVVVSTGKPISAEESMAGTATARVASWQPTEATVAAIAAECSVSALVSDIADQGPMSGMLATTA